MPALKAHLTTGLILESCDVTDAQTFRTVYANSIPVKQPKVVNSQGTVPSTLVVTVQDNI